MAPGNHVSDRGGEGEHSLSENDPRTIRARQRCGLVSDYFDHLFFQYYHKHHAAFSASSQRDVASSRVGDYALGAGEFTPRQLNDRHCCYSILLPAGGGCGVLLRRRKRGCDDRDRLRFGGSSRRNSFTGIALSGVGGGGLTMPPTGPASSVRFQLQSLG